MSGSVDAVHRRFERFVPLGAADRRFLSEVFARARIVEPRRTVLTEGRRCEALHLIAAGWALEYRLLPSGGRQILKIRLPGEVFGAECLAFGTALESVQTLTRCAISPIAREDYAGLQISHPRVAAGLFLAATADRAVLQEWALSLGRRPAAARVAHLLLEIEHRCALAGITGRATPFPLTQQDVADCTGLTLSYANRILGQMRRRGLITLRPQELAIQRRADLARIAGFGSRYLEPTPLGGFDGEPGPSVPAARSG